MTAGAISEMGLTTHLAPNLNKVMEMILAEIKPSASRCVIMQVLLSSSATDLIFSQKGFIASSSPLPYIVWSYSSWAITEAYFQFLGIFSLRL